jgi:hypothetical protein
VGYGTVTHSVTVDVLEHLGAAAHSLTEAVADANAPSARPVKTARAVMAEELIYELKNDLKMKTRVNDRLVNE